MRNNFTIFGFQNIYDQNFGDTKIQKNMSDEKIQH